MKSITDKAEVSVDFPDKAYMGAFGRESPVRREGGRRRSAVAKSARPGQERRELGVHLHYYLLADILREIGQGLANTAVLDEAHLASLREGADALTRALKDK